MSVADNKAVFLNIIASFVFAVVVYAVGRLVPAAFWTQPFTLGPKVTDGDVATALTVVAAIAIFIVLTTLRLTRRTVVLQGRENIMEANAMLVEQRLTDRRDAFRSTRVSHWSVREASPSRVRFRNAITQKLSEGFAVYRLWQIKDDDDLERMEHYLLSYKEYENYSLRVIVSGAVLIPEVILLGDRAASLSLPEPNMPRKIACCFHFFGVKEILSVRGYFDVLWDMAIPIKSGAQMWHENLSTVRRQVTELQLERTKGASGTAR